MSRAVRIVKKHPIFRVKPLVQLVADYLQYEDACLLKQILEFIVCYRPIALNFAEMIYMLVISPIEQVYIPKEYTDKLIIGDFSRLKDELAVKGVSLECKNCGEYNKLTIRFGETPYFRSNGTFDPGDQVMRLLAIQVQDLTYTNIGKPSSLMLCECHTKKRTGSFHTLNRFVASESQIDLLLNVGYVQTPPNLR